MNPHERKKTPKHSSTFLFNWGVCVSVRARKNRPSERSSGWRSVCLRVTHTHGVCARLKSYPARGLKWQHLTLGDHTLSLTRTARRRRSFLFCFHRTHRATLYRIYEKTHVELYHRFKPEGMYIFFVKLTFLLWLIARAKGEWRDYGLFNLSFYAYLASSAS